MILRAPGPGALVVAFLHSPKERVWGVLRGLDASGAWLEGIDLDSFEDWARQVGRRDAPAIGLSVAFYPLGRVEKLLLDRSAPGQPSFADRFQTLAGLPVAGYLGLDPEEGPQ
jgi:hypothetical protein